MLKKAGRTSCNKSTLAVRAGVASGLRSFGSGSDYYRAVLATQPDSLIKFLTMDDDAGTVAVDSSRSNDSGSYEGAVTLGQPGIDGRSSVKGGAGAVKFYSAPYVTRFNGEEGTVDIWMRVVDAAHWADGVDEYILSIFATNGQVRLRKFPSANLLQYSYVAGGVTDTISLSRYETRWVHVTMTWSKSAETAALYVNGTPAGTSATLGVWSGTLSANLNCFGALRNDIYSNPFKGYMQYGALWNKALTAQEIRYINDEAVPTVGVFCLGDSKTGPSYPWYRLAMDSLASDNLAFEERPSRYYTAGWKVSDLKSYVDANLANEWIVANRAWINIGANDLSAGTSEASFKSDLSSIVNSIRAKYNCDIYIATPWSRGYNTEAAAMKSWIASIASGYASGVYLGPDETVWMENGDNGVTYTIDGIHYNSAGVSAAAAQWAAVNS